MAAGERAGSRFGQYELRRLLGVGGMGEVYEAYDTVRDRVVAVKLLDVDLARQPTYVERFRRESRTAAKLQEPHVIPVHDWGEVDGVLFIDMRLVRGRDLKAYLYEEGPLPPERAVTVVEQIAAALDAAHESGLVHRDVKPANILLTGELFAYLVDFGIAHTESDVQLTQTGNAIGSFAYMAPERFEHNASVSPGADIYALACVLYECLTGGPPFRVVGNLANIRAHMLTPPPRPSVRTGIPVGLDQVVAIGMAKEPGRRYATAGQLARAARAALLRAAHGEPTRTTVPPAPPTIPSPPVRAGHSEPHSADRPSGPAGTPRPGPQQGGDAHGIDPSAQVRYSPGVQPHPSGPAATPRSAHAHLSGSGDYSPGGYAQPLGSGDFSPGGQVQPSGSGDYLPGGQARPSGPADYPGGGQAQPLGPVDYSRGGQPGGSVDPSGPQRLSGPADYSRGEQVSGQPIYAAQGNVDPTLRRQGVVGQPGGYLPGGVDPAGPRDHPSAPLPLPPKDRGSLPLVVGALLGIVLVLGAVLAWVLLSGSDTGGGTDTAGGTTTRAANSTGTYTTSASAPTTTLVPLSGAVSGTDAQGFTQTPRCNANDPAMSIGRTDKSRLVVCRSPTGRYYYKGLRISDSAEIQLNDPVPDGNGGFTVTNPTDGTQYKITAYGLVITKDGQVQANEPMVEYAHR
ncbi:serine/threonine-protein kinase [Nocardia tengchongensis]|uniref:serine/threonine-protein kinase n=1 Tax=Nocardia tengchongensis TaxID=2055889 RepID=UPI0036235857